MAYHYATQLTGKYADKQTVKVCTRNADISTKVCIEIASAIRNRSTGVAKNLMRDVMAKRRAIRYNRYNGDVGHKSGQGPGRYPVKAATRILGLLNSLEANAINLGIDTDNLKIVSVVVHKGANRPKYGRSRGANTKNTHVEIVAVPMEKKAKPKTTKKATTKKAAPAKKAEEKVEAKPVEAKKEEAPKAEAKTETKSEGDKQ